MPYEDTITALSDPTRRKLVERLRERPHAVGELAALLHVTQPAVSQHLAVLRHAGLVRSRRDAQRRLYQLDPAGLEPLRDYLDRLWTDALDAFARSFDAPGGQSP